MRGSQEANAQQWLARVLALAAGYCLTGWLSLLLAIQPGYAAALWPAAGIAVAGLLLWGNGAWPGVLLGSFLVNVGTRFDVGTLESACASLLVPLGIGAGATLQALVGAILIRCYVGFPNPLHQEKAILLLLLFAGPVSSLVNATWSNAVLLLAGRIQIEELGFAWWTWWVGDTIGAFLVTPLVLLWVERGRPDWPRRPITVSLPLVGLVASVVGLLVYTDAKERENLQLTFELQTESLTRTMQNRMDFALEALHSLQHFHGDVYDSDDRRRFTKTASETMTRRPSIRALTWNPRIPAANRIEFEKAAQAEYGADFAIRERGVLGDLVPAPQRPDYFPTLYVRPFPGDKQLLGFDLASDADFRSAQRQAMASATLTATPLLPIARHDSPEQAVWVLLPIYRDGIAPEVAAERERDTLGFVAAALRMDRLVDIGWEGLARQGIDIWILDHGGGPRQRIVYQSRSERGPTRAPPQTGPGPHRQVTIRAAGREWELRFASTQEFLALHRSLQPWVVLAGEMLFTGLLSALLLVVTGRAALVSAVVEKRTFELAGVNDTLRQEIAERRRAEEELGRSQAQSRQVIETAADAFVSMDADGRITEWNRRAEATFGWTRAEVLGRPLADTIMPPRYHQAHALGMERYRATGLGPILFKPQELTALRKDGREIPVELTVWPIQLGTEHHFNAFVRDITERRQAEERVRGLLESAPDPIVIVNEQGKIEIVNSQLERVFDYPRHELLGQEVEILMPDRFRATHPQFRAAFFQNPQVRPMGSGLELYGRRKDGSEFPVEISLSPLRTPTGILVTAAIRDITDRKALEREVLEVATNEQRRIGQELHDSAGQALTGLCMLADNLADALRAQATQEARLAGRISQGLGDALRQVRLLSRGLVPVEVDAEGLMSALGELASHIRELHVIRCDFDCPAPVPVEDNYTATQLYRIAQEAITNAIKHGQARRIQVSLESTGRYLTLRVADDGAGIANPAPTQDGLGLRIMRYRASQIGGQFTILPGPKGGTLVTCTLLQRTDAD